MMGIFLATAALLPAAVRPSRAELPPFNDDIGGSLQAIQDGSRELFQQISLHRRRPRRRRRHHRIRVAPKKTLNPPVSLFPVRGLDVSGYQGDIDWPAVAQAPEHYAFAYLRAAHGLEADDHFAQNWAQARAAGLRVGAYQLYTFCQDAATQAAQFTQLVPREADALPEVVDIEASKECPTLPPKDEFLRNLKVFSDAFQAKYGRAPMLYVNADVYRNYFAGDAVPNRIWFADPRQEPSLPDGHGWDFWQYAWKGKVPGIDDTEIDFDVYRGSRADFDAAFPAVTPPSQTLHRPSI